MKTKVLGLVILTMMFAGGAKAQDFGGKNGGGVEEKRFYAIADDLKSWIQRGGAKGLDLPESVTREQYESKMLDALNTHSVSFVPDTIMVNGVEKDCENTPSTKIIRCNIDRFKNASESDQYVITHHEFAGVAGLEENEGEARSNYKISDQITKSLEKVTILKLAVLPSSDKAIGSYANCSMQDSYSWGGLTGDLMTTVEYELIGTKTINGRSGTVSIVKGTRHVFHFGSDNSTQSADSFDRQEKQYQRMVQKMMKVAEKVCVGDVANDLHENEKFSD